MESHPLVLSRLETFPGLGEAHWLLIFASTMLFVIIAAISEEICYRGAILGPMIARCSKHTNPRWWIVLVATLFAIAHLLNTTDPAMKFAQTWVLGVGFGLLAWRRGLISAIVGHAVFNVLAIIYAFLRFPDLS